MSLLFRPQAAPALAAPPSAPQNAPLTTPSHPLTCLPAVAVAPARRLPRTRLALGVAGALAGIGLPTVSIALEPAPIQMREIMVTGGPGPDAIETLPGSAHFLSREIIEQQSYDDIHRLLARVPGVYTRGEDALGIFPNISLRGVDSGRSSKVSLMEDGILIAPAPYSAPAAYFNPATARMSGVEVLMGSSQVRYGPHTTGGVINYLSTPIPGQRAGHVRVLFGNHGELRAHVWAGDTFDTLAGRVGLLVEGFSRRNDGFKTIDLAPDFRHGNKTGLSRDEPMVKLAWEPAGDIYQRFEFRYGQTDLEADETYLGLSTEDFRRDPYRRYSSSRFDNIQTRQQRYYLRHFIALTDQLDLSTTLYLNQFSRAWYKLHNVRDANGQQMGLSNALAGAGEGLATLRGEAAGVLRVRNNNRDYEAYGISSVANALFRTGAVEHELALGLRWHTDWVRRDQFDDFFTQADNGTISDLRRGPPGAAGDRRQETDAVALFVRNEMSIGNWTITPGIRAEWLDQKFSDFQTNETGTARYSMVGGGLGAVYRVNDRWILFGGVHRGFSPPGPRAAARGGLREETSLAWELGTRWRSLDGALLARTTLFWTDFDNLIAIDNVGGAGSGNTENIGNADNKGVELEIQYDPGIAFDLPVSLPTFLALTYSDAKLRTASDDSNAESIFSGARSGNRIPYVPEWQFTFGTGVEVGPWSLNATLTYVDPTFTTGSNVKDEVDPDGQPDARFGRTDAHTTVDIQGGYDIRSNVNLFAGVHNLFDQEYIASRLPHGPRPGLPRTLFAGIDVSF